MESRTLLSAGVVSAPQSDAMSIEEVYLDALGRRPSSVETARILNHDLSPREVSARVYRSTEYRVAMIQRIAERYVGAGDDTGFVRTSLSGLRRGATETDLIARVLSSSAYRVAQGDTDAGFVAGLFRDVLGRRPDPAELSSWLQTIDSGASAKAVVRGFLQSPEAMARQVLLTVRGLLERPATTDEIARGVNRLKAGYDPSRFRALIASSSEYLVQARTTPAASPILGQTNVPDLSRLGLFNGQGFVAVTAGSIGSTITGQGGTHLYVISHGWAPGYRAIVDANSKPGDPIDWWQLQGAVVGTDQPYGPWLYAGTPGGEPYVSPLGLAQAITAYDPKAVVVAFSWVDDSATVSGITKLLDAYESEARTQVNGLRLAGAIEQAISPDFSSSGGQIHILGHSHGTKVATVAAAELIRVGVPVQHLTTFDSPEDDVTDLGDASNLLWYYLPGVNPSRTTTSGGTFVDNYISEFGAAFAGFPGLGQVVDVTLNPSAIYGLDDPGDKHTYPTYWYSGASGTGTLAPPPPKVALGWSPLINPSVATGLPAETKQSWTSAGQPQFALTTTQQTVPTTQIPTYTPLSYEEKSTQGNVTFNASSITLSEMGTSSVYSGKIFPEFDLDGITFNVQFTAPGDGDQLVVSIAGSTALVMDGLSAGTTTRSVAISLGGLIYDGFLGHDITITLASNGSATGSTVVLSNFQEFQVNSA